MRAHLVLKAWRHAGSGPRRLDYGLRGGSVQLRPGAPAPRFRDTCLSGHSWVLLLCLAFRTEQQYDEYGDIFPKLGICCPMKALDESTFHGRTRESGGGGRSSEGSVECRGPCIRVHDIRGVSLRLPEFCVNQARV